MSIRPDDKQPSKPVRLVSLDAFRGLTILGMLLVNNVALDWATPKHFTHAPWNQGVHMADMVFPWFLFIVGVAIPYAAASSKKRGVSHSSYLLKAFGRAITLVFLGCLVVSSVAKTPVIGLDVLQVIGLAYFVGVLAYPLKMPWRMALAAGLLLAHWILIRFVPFAGQAPGVFTESNNIIKYINDAYLNAYHLKGLISVVPTSAMVLIGTAAGDLIKSERIPALRKVALVVGGGVGLIILGLLWGMDLPFNKPVWTASYILYTAGWAALVFGIIYLIVDVKGWRAWAFPLVVLGMNAIAAYVSPILVKVYVMQGWHWGSPTLSLQQAYLDYCIRSTGRICGGWIFTMSYIVAWWLVMYVLYRKKLFLRV